MIGTLKDGTLIKIVQLGKYQAEKGSNIVKIEHLNEKGKIVTKEVTFDDIALVFGITVMSPVVWHHEREISEE